MIKTLKQSIVKASIYEPSPPPLSPEQDFCVLKKFMSIQEQIHEQMKFFKLTSFLAVGSFCSIQCGQCAFSWCPVKY